jgi:hypothetical protein
MQSVVTAKLPAIVGCDGLKNDETIASLEVPLSL